MKKSILARGFIGSVASLLGVLAVGCSSEPLSPEEAAEIGVSEQAVVLNPVLNPANGDVHFGGFLKITSNKTLWLGGYQSNGTAVTLAGIFDPTLASSPTDLRWQLLSVQMPDALGEVDIEPIPGQSNKFLVAGGRTSLNGTVSNKSYVLTLSGTDLTTATWVTTGTMNTARVVGLNNLAPCGTGAKIIAAGGMVTAGMKADATTAATESIEVFDYVAAPNEATSAWSTLRLASDTTKVVKLQFGRGYQAVLPVSTHEFRIAGGASAADVNALDNVEVIEVNDSCRAINTVEIAANDHRGVEIDPLPQARARMAWIPNAVTISSVAYDFVLAGGNNATANTAPTDVFYYDPQGNSGDGAFDSTTADLSEGRIFPRASKSGTSVVVSTGIKPDSGAPRFFDDTTTASDVLSNAGVRSAGNSLTTSRVGSFVTDAISGVLYTGFGATHVNSLTPTSMPGNVESY